MEFHTVFVNKLVLRLNTSIRRDRGKSVSLTAKVYCSKIESLSHGSAHRQYLASRYRLLTVKKISTGSTVDAEGEPETILVLGDVRPYECDHLHFPLTPH